MKGFMLLLKDPGSEANRNTLDDKTTISETLDKTNTTTYT